MNKEKILFLKSPLKEQIWGSYYFKDVMKLTDTDNKIGEYWTISGYPNSSSIIVNGKYKDEKLDELYKNHRELFNNSQCDRFPILVKMIATADDLSVQVHPNDEYAKKENDFGKTESWLILESDNGSVVYGHKARTKNDFIDQMNKGNIGNVLNKIEVKRGMFIPCNAGTVHALGKGLVLLEIQQSSNITYRLFDYDRIDKNGKKRELHIKKALEVLEYPNNLTLNPNNYLDDNKNKVLWDNAYFKVELININEEFEFVNNDSMYYLVTVCEGSIKVATEFDETYEVNLGNSFIITSLCKDVNIFGNGKIVVTKSYI